MALTTLDRNTALIVVDLQCGIISLPMSPSLQPVAAVIANSVALLEAFRRHVLPVVLVNVTGGSPGRTEASSALAQLPPGWSELIPELTRQPGDILITKRTRGAFTGTGLEEQLRTLGVTQVVLAGVATSGGVESTARQAYECGFHVTLALDALSDRSAEAHEYSVGKVFPKLGETGTTQQVLSLLEQTRA